MSSSQVRMLALGILFTAARSAPAQYYPYYPQPQQSGGMLWNGSVPVYSQMPYPMPMPPAYPPGYMPPPQARMMMPGAMPMPQGPMMPGTMPMSPGAVMPVPQARVMMPYTMPIPPAGARIPVGTPVAQAEEKKAEPAKDATSSSCEDKPKCCTDCCGKTWTVFGDALWLKRNHSDRVFLGQLTDLGSTAITDMSTDDVDFPYAPGMRVGLAYNLDDRRSIEALYFGLNHWSESFTLPVNALTSTFNSPYLLTQGTTDFYAFSYSSDIHNVELNYRRRLGNGLWQCSLLGGVRYLNLQEDFALFTAGATFGNSESTNVETSNNLIGGQLGGELTRAVGERSEIGLYGKAGLFLNFLNQNTTNVVSAGLGTAPTTRLDAFESDVSPSSIVEIGVHLKYHIRNNIIVRGGYDVFFINGLALAPEQLNGTNQDLSPAGVVTPGRTGEFVNDHGALILHGPFIGLELTR